MTETTKNCPACFQPVDARATRCSHCTTRFIEGNSMQRNMPGKVIGGVCAALAARFGWDPVLIRVLSVVSILVIGPVAFWVYGLVWALTPFDANVKAPAGRFADWLSQVFSPKPVAAPKPVEGIEFVRPE